MCPSRTTDFMASCTYRMNSPVVDDPAFAPIDLAEKRSVFDHIPPPLCLMLGRLTMDGGCG